MKVRGIIFDLDGTLIDSEESHFLAWQRTLKDYNYDFSYESYLSHHSGQTVSTIAKFNSQILCCNSKDLFAQKSLYYNKDKKIVPIVPTINFIRKLYEEKKLKLVIASASPKIEILNCLTYLNIIHYFDFVLSGEDDLKGYSDPEGTNKPKPYIYQEAFQLLGMTPSCCVIVEDSFIGVSAGYASGCFTVAIPNRFTQHHDFSHANLVLTTFSDLTPQVFVNMIEESRLTKNLPL